MSTSYRSVAAIGREVRAEWSHIVAHAVERGVRLDSFGSLPQDTIRLLGSSTKVEAQGSDLPTLKAIVYMAPATEAYRDDANGTLCGFAGACADICLAKLSGRMVMNSVARARLWKATLYIGNRNLWRELLYAEARLHIARAEAVGALPAIRPDGASDTAEGQKLAREFPELQVYDYTKNPGKARSTTLPANYDVTYSFHERTDMLGSDWVNETVRRGTNVAVVFDTAKGEPLPDTWRGMPVLDGDIHDERYWDPPGHIVGLRLKYNGHRDEAMQRAAAFAQSG